MPAVDPDPASIGTYLVCASILAAGIAIFLCILIGDARGDRGQDRGGRQAASESGAEGVDAGRAFPQHGNADLLCERWKRKAMGTGLASVDTRRTANLLTPR